MITRSPLLPAMNYPPLARGVGCTWNPVAADRMSVSLFRRRRIPITTCPELPRIWRAPLATPSLWSTRNSSARTDQEPLPVKGKLARRRNSKIIYATPAIGLYTGAWELLQLWWTFLGREDRWSTENGLFSREGIIWVFIFLEKRIETWFFYVFRRSKILFRDNDRIIRDEWINQLENFQIFFKLS